MEFEKMTKERIEHFIGSWDGDSSVFIFEGEMRTEDDVNEAADYLEANPEKK